MYCIVSSYVISSILVTKGLFDFSNFSSSSSFKFDWEWITGENDDDNVGDEHIIVFYVPAYDSYLALILRES